MPFNDFLDVAFLDFYFKHQFFKNIAHLNQADQNISGRNAISRASDRILASRVENQRYIWRYLHGFLTGLFRNFRHRLGDYLRDILFNPQPAAQKQIFPVFILLKRRQKNNRFHDGELILASKPDRVINNFKRLLGQRLGNIVRAKILF